jgi:hypothetical protein
VIPQRNFSLLSNRLARAGGCRIHEAILERDYCLAWFLVGLSRSALRERVVFKGGTAIKRCYFGDYRFSEDLDFTLTEDLSLDPIRAGLRCAAHGPVTGTFPPGPPWPMPLSPGQSHDACAFPGAWYCTSPMRAILIPGEGALAGAV